MARRVALIEEATALGAKAMERDAVADQAIQARWQAEAKGITLLQRDERALWSGSAACDAVFQARDAKRKEDGDRKHEERRALDESARSWSSSHKRPTRTSRGPSRVARGDRVLAAVNARTERRASR
jgi:hypothetical protein